MHTLCTVALVLAAAISTVSAMGGGSLFTSAASVHDLFRVEKEMGQLIHRFVENQQRTLQRISNLARLAEEAATPSSDVAMSTTQSFGVIKRLVTTVEALRGQLNPMADSEMAAFLENDLPGPEDLKGAAKGLLRLQRVYDIPPDQLLEGAEADDYLFVGKEAYDQEDYASAKEWLEVAVRMSNDTDILWDGFDYLSYVEYKLGDYEGALKHAEQLLELEPTNGRVMDNVDFYRNYIHERNERRKVEKRYDNDNYLGHSEKDVSRFRRLCRGETFYKPTINLKCTFETFGKPELLLKPIAVEQLREGRQRMVMFRNFASPKECEHLKTVGKAKLERAVAWEGGKFRPVTFRISTAAWLQPDHDDVISRLDKRMWQATQLNLEYAEALQVSNYGLGGFYETHFDYHGRQKQLPAEGDRLATFMIYLSDVEAGGFTAFPRLGVAVQPSEGDAVFWYDLLPSGQGDTDTLHGACPVLSGSKWVCNRWIHEKNNVCRVPE